MFLRELQLGLKQKDSTKTKDPALVHWLDAWWEFLIHFGGRPENE